MCTQNSFSLLLVLLFARITSGNDPVSFQHVVIVKSFFFFDLIWSLLPDLWQWIIILRCQSQHEVSWPYLLQWISLVYSMNNLRFHYCVHLTLYSHYCWFKPFLNNVIIIHWTLGSYPLTKLDNHITTTTTKTTTPAMFLLKAWGLEAI